MAEWEGLLIVFSFFFLIAGFISWLIASGWSTILAKGEESALNPRISELLAEQDVALAKAAGWRIAKNIFFFLFFAGVILTFIAHSSR
jgi:hypothetical protein